jgi:hypothetical protein
MSSSTTSYPQVSGMPVPTDIIKGQDAFLRQRHAELKAIRRPSSYQRTEMDLIQAVLDADGSLNAEEAWSMIVWRRSLPPDAIAGFQICFTDAWERLAALTMRS